MGLEKEAEIEIFANGISADIALADFRAPKRGRRREIRRSRMTLPFRGATIIRLEKHSHFAFRA